MSQDIGRRDTLKLASTMAALGAGLGVLFESPRASAAPTATAPGPVPPPAKPGLEALKLDSAAQFKISGYQNIKIGKGFVQIKMYSAAGQFLYAANMPEEIARALSDGSVLQIKFHKAGADETALPTPYAETQNASLKVVAPVKAAVGPLDGR